MKRIIIFGCIGSLFVLGLISTTVFAALYINSQNELKVKDAELAACAVQKSSEDTSCPTLDPISEELSFIDNGESIEVIYPSTWSGELTTNISDDYAFEPEYGRVISTYNYTLTKAGSTLQFLRIMGGVDGFPTGLTASTHDWVSIPGTDIVRYSSIGENVWSYVEEIDCTTLGEPFFSAEEVATFDVCIGSFFPGFGVSGASVATIDTEDADLLAEADLIAKSALN